jgi:hypothetical protein
MLSHLVIQGIRVQDSEKTGEFSSGHGFCIMMIYEQSPVFMRCITVYSQVLVAHGSSHQVNLPMCNLRMQRNEFDSD